MNTHTLTAPCPTCGGRGDVKPYTTFRAEREVCRRCNGERIVRAIPLEHTTPALEAWLAERRDPSWQPPAPPKPPRFPYGLKRIPARKDGLAVGAFVVLDWAHVSPTYREAVPEDVAAWQIVSEGGSGKHRMVGILAVYADHLKPLEHEAVA